MNKVVKTLILIIVLALIGWAVWFFVPQDADAPTDNTDEELKIVVADTSSVDTSDWLTFTNTKHGYRVQYPSDLRILESSHLGAPLETADQVTFYNEPVTRALFSVTFISSETPNATLPLSDYVVLLQELNEEKTHPKSLEGRVSDIQVFSIESADNQGYGFVVLKNYSGFSGGFIIDRPHAVQFFENNGEKYQLIFNPADPQAQAIFESFEFLD